MRAFFCVFPAFVYGKAIPPTGNPLLQLLGRAEIFPFRSSAPALTADIFRILDKGLQCFHVNPAGAASHCAKLVVVGTFVNFVCGHQ